MTCVFLSRWKSATGLFVLILHAAVTEDPGCISQNANCHRRNQVCCCMCTYKDTWIMGNGR